MVAVALMHPTGKKKKLETGKRQILEPLKLDPSEDGKPKSKRGSVRVYEELREDILWIRIDPGSVLDEVALAKRFGVSRTPVREALVMLASEDLLVFLPSRTSIVAPHMLDNFSEYLDSHLLLARSVARQAAISRANDDLARMRAAAQDYEDALESNDVYRIYGADLALHREISRSGHNHFSQKFHDLSLDCGRRSHVLHYFPKFGEAERHASRQEHADLIAAIEAGDPDKSDIAITRHLKSEMDVIKRTLEPKTGFDMAIADPSADD